MYGFWLPPLGIFKLFLQHSPVKIHDITQELCTNVHNLSGNTHVRSEIYHNIIYINSKGRHVRNKDNIFIFKLAWSWYRNGFCCFWCWKCWKLLSIILQSFCHRFVCPSIYRFWLPGWHIQTFLISRWSVLLVIRNLIIRRKRATCCILSTNFIIMWYRVHLIIGENRTQNFNNDWHWLQR